MTQSSEREKPEMIAQLIIEHEAIIKPKTRKQLTARGKLWKFAFEKINKALASARVEERERSESRIRELEAMKKDAIEVSLKNCELSQEISSLRQSAKGLEEALESECEQHWIMNGQCACKLCDTLSTYRRKEALNRYSSDAREEGR